MFFYVYSSETFSVVSCLNYISNYVTKRRHSPVIIKFSVTVSSQYPVCHDCHQCVCCL